MGEGTECAPIEFELEATVGINFNAKDVVRNLSTMEVVDLIKDLDLENNNWEASALLAAYFNAQLAQMPPDVAALSPLELVARIEAEDASEDDDAGEEVDDVE